MFRDVVLFAGVFAFLAPTLLSQNPTVCIFQQKQGRSAEVDAGFDSTTLAKELTAQMPATLTLNLVGISGFTAKEIDGEAQRRGCAWVITLWRDQLGPSTPNYAGTLGGTQVTTGQGTQLWVKGTKLGAETLLEYSLRKADSRKPIAHGDGNDETTYTKFAETIVKKIQKEK